jgi:hypothetical protein
MNRGLQCDAADAFHSMLNLDAIDLIAKQR